MEELRGHHALWGIDDETIRIRFDSGLRVPALFKALGGAEVPLAAAREVDFYRDGRKHGWRPRVALIPGLDPCAGPGASHGVPAPLVVDGPHDTEPVAEYAVGKICELGRLHAEGLLTDQEFADKKAELLGRL